MFKCVVHSVFIATEGKTPEIVERFEWKTEYYVSLCLSLYHSLSSRVSLLPTSLNSHSLTL